MTMTIINLNGTNMLNDRQKDAIKLVLLIHTAPKDSNSPMTLDGIIELIEEAMIDNKSSGETWK